MKHQKYETNTFYHYANEYRKNITEEDEIETINMTETFWKELNTIIDKGELINLNINAPPTSGKTVTGCAIAQQIMKNKFNKKFGIQDIDRDQQEFSKTMRNPQIKNTIRVIDEWNELETTGENSSVETALYNYFSDVMAQRFIHKISCSPKEESDKNALIYLEVISTDKIKQINHCRLYYKIFNAGMEYKQLLGYVNISVKEVLNKKWYKQYVKRKFEKMDLILQEGIFRPRVLEYAHIILTVTNQLKKLTKLSNVINANIIRNYIKMQCKENKIVQSIVGEELATREVQGILDLYKAYHKVTKQIKRYEIEHKQGKLDNEELQARKTQLEEMQNEIKNAWMIQEKELENYKKIHQKYNKTDV